MPSKRGGRARRGKLSGAGGQDEEPPTCSKVTTRRERKLHTAQAPGFSHRKTKKGFPCPHVAPALAENGEQTYRDAIDEFVIPSSKCIIPWDPVQSKLRFSCEKVTNCSARFEFVCCQCKQKLCRLHSLEHAKSLQHGCLINVEVGYVACFCCGEKLVQMEKWGKLWREQRLKGIYETALRHGWLSDRTELDSFLPEELREACENRNALVGVHGIVNLSNTCCLSVLLQAFCHTPLFRDFCLARLHRCSQDDLRFNPNCVMCAFTSMIFDLYILPPGECYAPKRIFQAVQNSLSDHGSELGEQEDPAEMINILLNDMHLQTEHDGRKISESLSKQLHLNDRQLASHCVEHGVYCSCIVCDMFSGIEEYTTTCSSCKQDRVQGNSFRLLMLPIREDLPTVNQSSQGNPKAELSLEDCLKMYTDHHSSADIKNECCNVFGAARTNKFRHLPVSLIIQLKRAVAKTPKTKVRDGDLKKNRDHIRFPLDLDMAPYMASEFTGATKYKLYAVIVHKGAKLTSGHYVCYVKHISGRWLCMDDRAVFYFTEENVLEVQAYMLFYIHDTVNFLAESPVRSPPPGESSDQPNGYEDPSNSGSLDIDA